MMEQPGTPANDNNKPKKEGHSLSKVSKAYLENHDFLKNFLKRFFSRSDDVEDMAQEAYLNAYRAEQERDIAEPKAFLFRIAKNLALNELNRKSQKMTDYIEDRVASVSLASTETVEEELEARQAVRLYCEAVDALPKRCRQVYLLRKVNGMRHKEIAEQLGITTGAVEKHLCNGVKSCRAYIKEANSNAESANLSTANTQRSTGGIE